MNEVVCGWRPLPLWLCRVSRALLRIHTTLPPGKQQEQAHKAACEQQDKVVSLSEPHCAGRETDKAQTAADSANSGHSVSPRWQKPGHSPSWRASGLVHTFLLNSSTPVLGKANKSVFVSCHCWNIFPSTTKSLPNAEGFSCFFFFPTLGNLNKIFFR